MHEDDELRTLLATYRRHTSLSPTAEDRILARVRDSVERQPDATAERTSTPVGWIAVGLAAAAALAVLWLRPVKLEGEREQAKPDAAAHVADSGHGEHEVAPTAPSGSTAESVDLGAATDQPEASVDPSETSSPSELGRPGARPRAPEGGRSAVEDSPPMSAQQALAEEAALLRRANALLSSGDASRAFDLLQQWETDFAPGHLREEHAALRAIALCALGRSIQGRGEAKAFERRHPSSAFVERVRSACSDDREKNATGSTPAGQ